MLYFIQHTCHHIRTRAEAPQRPSTTQADAHISAASLSEVVTALLHSPSTTMPQPAPLPAPRCRPSSPGRGRAGPGAGRRRGPGAAAPSPPERASSAVAQQCGHSAPFKSVSRGGGETQPHFLPLHRAGPFVGRFLGFPLIYVSSLCINNLPVGFLLCFCCNSTTKRSP